MLDGLFNQQCPLLRNYGPEENVLSLCKTRVGDGTIFDKTQQPQRTSHVHSDAQLLLQGRMQLF